MEGHNLLAGPVQGEIVEKKSRFICYFEPVDSEEAALERLAEIKREHRLARHHVFAYSLARDGRVRYSDDGEPPKTAGLPVLQVLQSSGAQDVLMVVVRYFGGILLGTGGLVRAYTQAAQAALEQAKLVRMEPVRDLSLRVPYALLDQVRHLAGEFGEDVVELDARFADVVELDYRARVSVAEEFAAEVVERTQGRVEPVVGEEQLAAI